MARSVDEAFVQFISDLVPSKVEKTQASDLRTHVFETLNAALSVETMFETGSLTHGTAVAGHCDADHFLIMRAKRPDQSDSALEAVKRVFRFPFTYWYQVKVRRPAVVISDGFRLEIVPAFRIETTSSFDVFEIPAPGGNWMRSSPRAHLSYVTRANQQAPSGRAKSLARLLKAWKYKNSVPISSFYLEMRAAQYVNVYGPQNRLLDVQSDFAFLLADLASNGLRAMNDPEGVDARIAPCSSTRSHSEALSSARQAGAAAVEAVRAEMDDEQRKAFDGWRAVFGSSFPSRYPWL